MTSWLDFPAEDDVKAHPGVEEEISELNPQNGCTFWGSRADCWV